MSELCELKVKQVVAVGTPWEVLPIAQTLPEGAAWERAREIAQDPATWEVRLNRAGSGQGHYIAGRKADPAGEV